MRRWLIAAVVSVTLGVGTPLATAANPGEDQGSPPYELGAASNFDPYSNESPWIKTHVQLLRGYPPYSDRYVPYGVPVIAYHDYYTEFTQAGKALSVKANRELYVVKVTRDKEHGYAGTFMDDVNFAGGNIPGSREDLAALIEEVRVALGPGGVLEINAQYHDIWPLIKAGDPSVLRALKYVNVHYKEFGVGPTSGINTPIDYREVMEYMDYFHAKGEHTVMSTDANNQTVADAEYCLATLLLANDGLDYSGSNGFDTPPLWWPGFDIDIGDALGPRVRSSSGLWKREFTGGVVYTVEPGAPEQTVEVTRPATNANGESFVAGTKVKIQPAHGLVLKQAASEAHYGSEGHYVSTTGNDSNAGTAAAPWRHVSYAAAHVGSGDIVFVEGGSYPEDVTLGVSGADESSRIRFYPIGQVTIRSLSINASHVFVWGINISGASGACVTVQPALTDIKLQHASITDCGGSGIDFTRPSGAFTSKVFLGALSINPGSVKADHEANDLTIYGNGVRAEGLDLTGTPNDVVNLWGDHISFVHDSIHDISNSYGNHNDVWQTWTDSFHNVPVTNLLVERNTVRNVTGSDSHGLIVEGSANHDWTIRSNVWSNIGSIGLILGVNGQGETLTNFNVSNNTFYKAGGDAVEFNANAGTGVLASNIIYSSNVYRHAGMSVAQGYNDYYLGKLEGGFGYASSDLKNVNPLLVNPPGGDFHETTGSPTINAGDNGALVPVRSVDVDGNRVGAVDIGAYEHP